jgi:hypothetical protein
MDVDIAAEKILFHHQAIHATGLLAIRLGRKIIQELLMP